MLYLPQTRSTPALIAFGIVAAALGFVLITLAHVFVIATPWLIVGAFTWVAFLAGIMVWNVLWLEKPYDLYNRIVGKLVIRPFRRWILAVTFGVTILANRPFAGRILDRGEGGRSTWHEKVIQDLLGGSGSSDVSIDDTRQGRWLAAWVSWIRRTGNTWMFGLIPFLLVLGIFDTGEGRSKVPKDTYTLY